MERDAIAACMEAMMIHVSELTNLTGREEIFDLPGSNKNLRQGSKEAACVLFAFIYRSF
jgi:hypothetical protein